MADATPGTTAPAAGNAGFGKFIAGLVLGIVIGGFAGAYITPMVGNQSVPSTGTGKRAGTTPHQAEEEAARKQRDDAAAAEAAAKKASDATKPPPPAPGAPPATTPPATTPPPSTPAAPK